MDFDHALKQLNPAQKKAVETTEGPVMVIAGPGTGKTQVLALRIAHILKSTDTPASGILCLTFTRSGVSAMRNRLESYIGLAARDVKITTFHSFAIELIEKYFHLLNFTHLPQLLTDTDAVFLVDQLLQEGNWQHIRPRTDPTKYFHDLKSLISILKRERLTPEQFLIELEREIEGLQNDPESISSRGASKGQLKQEVVKKIEGLDRTREVVLFFEQYEALKRERALMDYDDVLEYAVTLAEQFDDVRDDLRENFLYVLVDEHQDSSGVQNSFLKAIWHDVEKPNIFVVGDDRQLIYGFSGARMDYFSEFKTFFGIAMIITLTENYRSSKPILSVADALLQSSLADGPLLSNRPEVDQIKLSEFAYTRDEIIGAGLYFKKVIKEGVRPTECALLVPKNRHVKTALTALKALGLPVVSEQGISLLELPETASFLRVLSLIADPNQSVLIAESLLDKTSNIPPLVAHTFIKDQKKKEELTLDDLIKHAAADGMFEAENPIGLFGIKLKKWIDTLTHERVSHIVSTVGNELLIDQATTHEELLLSIEVVRSFIHTASAWEEKYPIGKLTQFIEYFTRLNAYGNHIEVATFEGEESIRVMTLHKSKGLEYEHVWIAHMNQEIFMAERPTAFSLPETVKNKITERDILTAKRELYVAITRAKVFCTLSYATKRTDGKDLTLAHIIEDVDTKHFVKTTKAENEKSILTLNPRYFTAQEDIGGRGPILADIQAFVRERFTETRISVSMLNNFFECPWKWYFRNFLKLPEAKSVSLALGSVVHETIEYILKSPTLPDETAIKSMIDFYLIKEGITQLQEKTRLAKDAYIAVKTWIDGYYDNLAQDRTSERNISYRDPQFPSLTMFGKIDLTERFSGGSLMVTDFKTGTSKTGSVIEKIDEEGRLSDYMRQLAMYSYLIAGAEKTDVSESRLLFLEAKAGDKHALYKTHVGGEEIDLLVRDIGEYQDFLSSGEWVNRPCQAKSYGTSSECEYCVRIKRIMHI